MLSSETEQGAPRLRLREILGLGGAGRWLAVMGALDMDICFCVGSAEPEDRATRARTAVQCACMYTVYEAIRTVF